MEIKFKIKNIYGEEKWWAPLEKIDCYRWILGDGEFCSHPDKVLLSEVVNDYRSLCLNEPLLAKLVKVPSTPVYIKALFNSWVEHGDDWLKAFIYAYQETGEQFYNAVDLANATVWTGVKFDREDQNKSYENIGEYFARASGFVDCLNEPEKLRETLRLADFARVQEKHLGERLRASATFSEWLLINNEWQ